MKLSPKGIVYVLVVKTDKKTLKIGALGTLEFDGTYAYVGSDQRGGRLARHIRKGKVLKWHIDNLTEVSEIQGAWILPLSQENESEFAKHLAKYFPVIQGFCSSDCKDAGHLFRVDEELEQVVAEFAEHKGVAYKRWEQNSKNSPA